MVMTQKKVAQVTGGDVYDPFAIDEFTSKDHFGRGLIYILIGMTTVTTFAISGMSLIAMLIAG